MDLDRDGGPGTYSIVAVDPATGEVGVGVQSRYFAVGRIVPWVRPGVGAVATQSNCNASYGPEGLDLLAQGVSPAEVIERLSARDPERETRQWAIIDMAGEAACRTGSQCNAWAGQRPGTNCHAQGNLLSGPEVVDALADEFARATGSLADRIMRGLEAAEAAGGDLRGSQSAAILVYRWDGAGAAPYSAEVDLRVDDHGDPIGELRRIYQVREAQGLAWQARQLARDGAAGAAAAMADALTLNPRDDLVLAMAAEVAFRQGDRARAAELLRQAMARNEKAICYVTIFGADELYDDAFRREVIDE